MREIKTTVGDLMPLIEEKLAAGGEVYFSPHGTSMLPTLKAGRDTLILILPPPRLKKYDIALYKRDNGQYIVHRVVHVGAAYTFAGDNQFEYEKNIEHSRIIALCTAYLRNGKRVELDSFRARTYASLLHSTRFLRRCCRSVLLRVNALFKK